MKFHLTYFDNKSTFSHFVDYNMEKPMKYNGKERDFLDRTEQVVCHFSWAHHHLFKQVRSRLLCNGLCFCKILSTAIQGVTVWIILIGSVSVDQSNRQGLKTSGVNWLGGQKIEYAPREVLPPQNVFCPNRQKANRKKKNWNLWKKVKNKRKIH